MLPRWPLRSAFRGSTEDSKRANGRELPAIHTAFCTFHHLLREIPSPTKSEYDNFNGLIQSYSQLFMNILLPKAGEQEPHV